MVLAALGRQFRCDTASIDASGGISIDELTDAVRASIEGCSVPPLAVAYAHREYELPGLPRGDVQVLDLNGDGTLDILTQATGQDFFQVYAVLLYGRTDGGFAPPVLVRLGQSGALSAGDVDGDGRQDLVARPWRGSEVLISFARDDGGFSAPIAVEVGENDSFEERALLVADLDADGRADVVVGSSVEDTITVLSRWSSQGFASRRTLDTPPAVVAIDAGDVNGDGFTDLVTASTGSTLPAAPRVATVAVYAGPVSSSPGEPQLIPLQGRRSVAITIGDFDRDGIDDIAAADQLAVGIVLLFGASDGPTVHSIVGLPGTAPDSVAVGEVDGDPRTTEIVSVGGHRVDILSNPLSAREFVVVRSVPTTDAQNVALGDFDGDGADDVVIEGSTLAVLTNSGSGSFVPRIDAGALATDVAAADVDGDGRVDLVSTSGRGSDIVSVHRGRGDGSFDPAVRLTAGSAPSEIAVVHIDGDGALDLVVANQETVDLSIFLSRGGGEFFDEIRIEVDGEASSRTHNSSFAPGDVDGDGRIDLVVNKLFDISVLEGLGDGSFVARQPTESVVGSPSLAVVLRDMNGDGVLDLVSAGMSVRLGNGAGSFGLPTKVPVSNNPGSVAVGDLNGDDVPDLVSSAIRRGLAETFLGDGDGKFRAVQSTLAGRGTSRGIVLFDVNNDGALDLVRANPWDRDVSVLVGRGDGTFRRPTRYAVGGVPEAVAVADFNGDRVADIAVANGSLLVLLGRVSERGRTAKVE